MSKADKTNNKRNLAGQKDNSTASLCEAIVAGNTDLVRKLAENETLVNGFDVNNGWKTPLMFAVESGNADIVKLLLDKGADPHLRVIGRLGLRTQCLSPLELAKRKARNRKYDKKIVKLLEKYSYMIDDVFGNEVCHNMMTDENGIANYKGDLCEYVRENVIENKVDINIMDEWGNTMLLLAVQNENILDADKIGVIEFLLKNGADPNISNSFGMTPLTMAFDNSLYDLKDYSIIVKQLLEHGADLGYAVCWTHCTADVADIWHRVSVSHKRNVKKLAKLVRAHYEKKWSQLE